MKNRCTRRLPILLLFFVQLQASGQDTLPRFTVVAKAYNRNLVSWTNPFPHTSQISIQRSSDSTKNFKTILTVPDPNVPQNGFVDTRAPAPDMFYRLFIVLDSGKYQFSKSRRPMPDNAPPGSSEPVLGNDNQRVKLSDSMDTREVTELKEKLKPSNPVMPKPEKFFIIKRKDSIAGKIAEKGLKRFRDSILYSTRDTMVFASVDTILISPFVPREVYRASKYVYTEKYGNVMLSLPDAGKKKYSVSFFDEDESPLFDISEVKSTPLLVDKSNFLHAGWFWFELYEDGKLKEKHKFFIPKDF